LPVHLQSCLSTFLTFNPVAPEPFVIVRNGAQTRPDRVFSDVFAIFLEILRMTDDAIERFILPERALSPNLQIDESRRIAFYSPENV